MNEMEVPIKVDTTDLARMMSQMRLRKRYSDEESDSSSIEVKDEQELQKMKFLKIMGSLPHYEPSHTLLQALDVDFTTESLIVNDAKFDTYLQSQCLDYDNVCSVLSTLLSIEDVSTMHVYSQLMQSNVVLTKVSKLGFSFKLRKTTFSSEEVVAPFQDEVVLIPKASLMESPLPKQPILALLPHRHEQLSLKDPRCRYIATVDQVTRTEIQLVFKRKALPAESALSQQFHIVLRSRRTPFRFMYRAMQMLEESPKLRRYLFPLKSPRTAPVCVRKQPDLTLFNNKIAINAEQLQAVQQLVSGPSRQAPYIVFGPPGTGKTTTIVEAILQLRFLHPRSRILVTAGSNSACDTIALKLCEYFKNNERLQARLAERSKESRLVTNDVKLDYQLMRLFSRSVFFKGLNSVHPLLLTHSNCAKHTYDHLSVDKLREYGIVVATLCTVGRLVTCNLGKFGFYTHLFIDEAGASTEPESLIGILGIKQNDACHVVLSGDHKQLGAVIKSNRAAQLGLRISLMERLLRSDLYALDAQGKYDYKLQTRLRRNYRSHPEIVGLYNKLYYNGELLAMAPPAEVNLAAKWRMLPNPKFPIIFQATHGKTERERYSTSSYNDLEAQVLCWYVTRLLSTGLDGGVKVQQEDIGVVAPYAAQCRRINELLRAIGYPHVEVGSVENYQGREKPIIIATLVRSFAGMGFLRNPRRLNVLLSRAKSLMILIGNPVTLRYHRDINFIINECKLQGNYLFKKKDGLQRPLFLNDMDDYVKKEDDNNNNESAGDLVPWYANMPQDIIIALPTTYQQTNISYCSSISYSNSSYETNLISNSISASCNFNTNTSLQISNTIIPSDPKKNSTSQNFFNSCATQSVQFSNEQLRHLHSELS